MKEALRQLARFLCVPSNWLCVAFVLGMIQYGSTKGKVTVYNTDTSVQWLRNNGSYVTNDYVHVALTRSPLLPDSATFYCYRRPVSLTNAADWVQHFTTTVGRVTFPTNVMFQAAWSNNWIVGTDYVRSQTHTNGVAIVTLIRAGGTSTNVVVPFRVGIYTNGNHKIFPKEL